MTHKYLSTSNYYHAALNLIRQISREEKLEIYKSKDFNKIRNLPLKLGNNTYYPFSDFDEKRIVRLLVPRGLSGNREY